MTFTGGIPVRNLWLLMLYASDLLRHLGSKSVSVEAMPDDLPDLVASILVELVEKRIRRNLSRGYIPTAGTLRRVRGRIDWLTTEKRNLVPQGKIACRYESFTVDTERNRYVCNALLAAHARVRQPLAQRCRELAASLERLGVDAPRGQVPRYPQVRFGPHDYADAEVLAAARLMLELALLNQEAGQRNLLTPETDEEWLRKLYERAVAGFYRHRLAQSGWQVVAGGTLQWPVSGASSGLQSVLPSMKTDVVLERVDRRIVIDTKFTSILTKNQFGVPRLKRDHLFQIYAYIRSREGTPDALAETTEGLLLYPAVGLDVTEEATFQGHRVRFWTVDLAAEPRAIAERLLSVVEC